MIYVLRLKNEKHGHIFYSYLEGDHMNKDHMVTEKMKYAEEFESLEYATGFLSIHDRYDLFEVIDIYTANDEYYKE